MPKHCDTPEEAVAESWASMDGKLEKYREEPIGSHDPGYRDGYDSEASEIIKRIEARGYKLVPVTDKLGFWLTDIGLNLHFLVQLYQQEYDKATPEDSLSGNPSKWPVVRGVKAVVDTVLRQAEGTRANADYDAMDIPEISALIKHLEKIRERKHEENIARFFKRLFRFKSKD